jgi:uncharacterized protein (TIGR02145 family)
MKHIRFCLSAAFLVLVPMVNWAQVGIGTYTPNPSSKLDVSSTTQGFLPPRMTSVQRKAIASPADGLLVYQGDYPSGLYYYRNGSWSHVSTPAHHPSVTIGNQKWMEKNLDVTTYRNGDTIAYVPDPATWASMTTGAWCYYNNDPSTNVAYGKLYNWFAVNDPRGLAPIGWHIPSDAEWAYLENQLGGATVAGGALKVTGTTTWSTPNVGATNTMGWAALPAGYRNWDGTFNGIGLASVWWSSTETDPLTAWSASVFYGTSYLDRYDAFEKESGYSIRCVRD